MLDFSDHALPELVALGLTTKIHKMILDEMWHLGFAVKSPPENAGDIGNTGLIPGLGRSPGKGHGNPPQYSCLESSIDRGDWQSAVPQVTKLGHD